MGSGTSSSEGETLAIRREREGNLIGQVGIHRVDSIVVCPVSASESGIESPSWVATLGESTNVLELDVEGSLVARVNADESALWHADRRA